MGVIKLAPVAIDEPPNCTVYHLIVPADAVAPKVTVPILHLAPSAVDVTLGCTPFPILAITAVLVAEVHPEFVASI